MSVLVEKDGIELRGLTHGNTGQQLAIPPGIYWMRACCRGRSEIASKPAEQPWDDEEFFEGIEVYRFDLWES